MPGVKVPSLQHLARVYDNDPIKVKNNLLRVANGTPIFSYNQIHPFIMDYLSLGVEYAQIIKAISRLKSDLARKNYAEIFPLLKKNYESGLPSFVHTTSSLNYPISREILVPFSPPMIYRIGAERYLPWFIFWRDNPLRGETFSLFATLVRDMMDADPDLSHASLKVIDLSAPRKKGPRTLQVRHAKDMPLLTQKRKQQMLEVFSEGYLLAKSEYNSPPPKIKKEAKDERKKITSESDEIGFFD